MLWEPVSSERVMGRGEQASGGMEAVAEEGDCSGFGGDCNTSHGLRFLQQFLSL